MAAGDELDRILDLTHSAYPDNARNTVTVETAKVAVLLNRFDRFSNTNNCGGEVVKKCIRVVDQLMTSVKRCASDKVEELMCEHMMETLPHFDCHPVNENLFSKSI